MNDAHNHYMEDGMQEATVLLEQTAISLASATSHRGRPALRY